MRALVTGCAGFIGSHLTESLLQDGHEVLGVDCFNGNYGRAQKLRNLELARGWEAFEFVPLDLARGELEDLVADSDVIFHLAAEPGVRPSWSNRFEAYLRNNVLATQHLLEAATRAGGQRFVYASSSSIYGEAEALPTPESVIPRPYSPYGVTKLGGEQLCSLYHANHGLETVALRYFSVYGPRQRPDMAFMKFCVAALEARPAEVYGDGRQSRDFTFVGDVVDVTRAAATAPAERVAGRSYNVGGGSRVALPEAIAVISEVSGRPLEVVRTESRAGDVRHTAADTSAARAELSYAPATSLRDGLRAQWEWVEAMHDRIARIGAR